MKIVFMGTPDFAVGSLDSLIKNGYNVVAVVTAPDKPAGRGQQLQSSAVKKFALQHSLKIMQPTRLKDPEFLAELKALGADLQFVVAFRMLPEEVWNMPKLGTYNLHASLLPRYRGAAPINWAIINGERESGVTTFKLKHEIDTGNILFQERVPIDEQMNAGELHDLLMNTGAKLVVKTASELKRCLENNQEPTFKLQDETRVSHAPKIFKDTCQIDWNEPVEHVHNLIRGLSPYPGAFSIMASKGNANKVIKIYATHLTKKEHSFTNGFLITDNKTFVQVAANGGVLNLLDLQLEGKKRMLIQEFLRGFKFAEGDCFFKA